MWLNASPPASRQEQFEGPGTSVQGPHAKAVTAGSWEAMLTIGPGRGRASFHKRRWFHHSCDAGLRRTMSRTCVAAHRPPRAVGTPRASSCAAMPLYERTPVARISAITGASAWARMSAWATSPAWPPLGPARLLCSSRVPILELIQCERRSVLLRGPHDTRSEAFARLNRPPASNCSIFSGWRGQTLVRFSYCSGAVRAADCS
jgi:hypothetical protein